MSSSNITNAEVPVWLRELCERLESDEKAMLSEVNLNIRRLTYEMMSHLCHVLLRGSCSALRSLNLTSSLIDRIEMTSGQVAEPLIRDVLSSSTCSLRILHLSYNRLAGPLHGLGKSMAVNQTLTELYLDHNRIDCEAAIELSQGLRRNQTLQVLQLSSNVIGDRGATNLAEALVFNKCLRSLGLSRNVIGEAGVQAFVETLWKHKNTTLKFLDMQNNKPSVSAGTLGWLATLCQANALGRRILLFQADSVPGIVAPLLAKACHNQSALYVLLQEKHSILPSSALVVADHGSPSSRKKARRC